ncbi:MAG: Rieske 2Fe-2S domain-containing protein [Pseudomonadota bacterium]
MLTDEALAQLVGETRVHRRVYTDPDIFDLEMARIWGTAWIFVGHDSMVPGPGDFITTKIGKQPVIMVRDTASGEVHVLANRCGHRGVKLAQRSHGTTRGFRCPYHGWSYRTNGALAGVPHPKGYDSPNAMRAEPCYQIKQIPRVDSYRGFYFASLAEDGPPLEAFLGDTKATIDNLTDRSPEGRIEVVGKVSNRFVQPSNWKNFVENLVDAMHPMVAHGATGKATAAYVDTLGEEAARPPEAEVIHPFGGSYDFFDTMGQTALPLGHNYMGGEKSIFSHYGLPEDYVDAMREAYGEARMHDILSFNRHNTTVYPSLAVRDGVQSIRVVRPVAVDETIIETWVFRLVGAPKALLDRTLLYSRLINAPGSMVGPDDLDCYYRMQRGLMSDLNDWVDFSRFAHDDQDAGHKKTGVGTSDLVFRNQYQAWLGYMTENANP